MNKFPKFPNTKQMAEELALLKKYNVKSPQDLFNLILKNDPNFIRDVFNQPSTQRVHKKFMADQRTYDYAKSLGVEIIIREDGKIEVFSDMGKSEDELDRVSQLINDYGRSIIQSYWNEEARTARGELQCLND